MNGTPKNFAWNAAPTGQIDPEAYLMLSAMPNWSPIGQFLPTTTRFFDAYSKIFDHVTFEASPEQQQALQNAKNQVTEANNALNKVNSDCNQAYLTAKQNGGIVFAAKYPDVATWVKESPEAEVYAKESKAAAETAKKAIDFEQQLANSLMPETLQNARNACKMPDGDPATSTAPRGWVKVPDGSGILRWQPDFIVGTSGSDWRNQLSSGSQGAFTITVDSGESNSTLNKSWAGGSAGYDAFFWGVHGSGGWQKLDISSNDSSLKAVIKVQSSTLVDVQPGAWYDGGFLNELAKAKQGPSGQGFTITSPWVANGPEGSSSLFGQHGILTTGVVQLLVAYKPSFEVTMSEETYQRNYEKFNGGGGFRIGPFSFGGDGGHESDYVHSTSGKNTFKGESTSENPVILGVVVSFPGGVEPNVNISAQNKDPITA